MSAHTLSSETKAEQIARVRQMATDDGETWDLSLNDRAALEGVIADWDALLAALKAIVAILQKEAPGTALNHHQYDGIGMQAHAAIAKAEGTP